MLYSRYIFYLIILVLLKHIHTSETNQNLNVNGMRSFNNILTNLTPEKEEELIKQYEISNENTSSTFDIIFNFINFNISSK